MPLRPTPRRGFALFACLALLGLMFASSALAAPPERPFLSSVFGDHMVLQRGQPATFWGWTQPGQTVEVTLAGRAARTTAAADGRWEVAVEPPPAGGPYAVTVTGPESVELQDVLVGDVWLCSGQSNMAWPLRMAEGGDAIAAEANLPQIRLFRVEQTVAYSPADDVQGEWQVSSPATAADFSAVGFLFGRRLHQELGVPIGLIQSAVGGSPVESWMSAEALAAFPAYHERLAEIERLERSGATPTGSFLMHWLEQYDPGHGGETWGAETLDDTDWETVDVPGGFAELGVAENPSIVWFRRDVVLPDTLPEGPARLRLGVVEKMDTAYLNGKWIGASSWVENPRNYLVPEGVLRPGRNQLAVRVFKLQPDGGFQDPGEGLQLVLGDGTSIPLAGEWKARVSLDAPPPHPLPFDYENYPTMPTVLYQGMVAPLQPLALTGALWYQGEANFTRAYAYQELLPAMITDWRKRFEQGDFPVYIVSLPAFMARRDQPGEDAWAELREAQALTVRQVPNTGLAVTVDTGDAADIHPRDKVPVAERLALLALDRHYGRDVVSSGPTVARVEREGDALVIYFEHTAGGLEVRGGPPEFALAGEDRTWHRAEVTVREDAVVLRAPGVREPVAARYAWQANPQATLFNGAGLPAAPFRTDDWPWSTAPAARD